MLGQFENSSIIIYYGSKSGFTRENRRTIECPGRSLGIQLADYNKDNWLDIAVNSYNESVVRVFYGSPEGFAVTRKSEVDAPSVIDLETADLNKDGWLDIIACCYSDLDNNSHFDMGLLIFWGNPKGFSHANAQWLPSSTPLGPVVADFDGDGYLDLFAPSYHADLTREMLPSYLYWGSGNGFHTNDRVPFINNSASDGLAADFDKDGRLDLAVSNHTVDGDHHTFSKIFYNDGDRFSNPRIEKIPTVGPHWSNNEDMGHIYDRSWKQFYESSLLKWNNKRLRGNISYSAEIPEGSRLLLEVRSSENKADITNARWINISDSGQFILSPRDRYLQYKAVFVSDNGDRFPVLDKVRIELLK